MERLTAAGLLDCRFMSDAERVAHGYKPKHRPGEPRIRRPWQPLRMTVAQDLCPEHVATLRAGIAEFRQRLDERYYGAELAGMNGITQLPD